MLRSQKPSAGPRKASTMSDKFQAVRSFGPLGLFVIAIHLSGCVTAAPLNPTIDHLPSVSKIPLSVGVYYSPAFRSYKYEIGQLPACKTTFGQASMTLFE